MNEILQSKYVERFVVVAYKIVCLVPTWQQYFITTFIDVDVTRRCTVLFFYSLHGYFCPSDLDYKIYHMIDHIYIIKLICG